MAWAGFIVFVVLMLALDLGVFHRKSHEVGLKESLIWTCVWIGLALTFNVVVWVWHGPELAMQFLAGYLIEKSLSVDNLFVFLILFSYFKVPKRFQHKVLFWGVLGALIMRAAFIAGGIALIREFDWVLYFFGALLIYTAVKLVTEKEKKIEPEQNLVMRIIHKFIPFTDYDERGSIFVRRDRKIYATPLFAVLVLVETMDVVFAIDSIPAIFAVTLDPFIVFTSNVFAILGLRSLYFALAGAMEAFHHLNIGLAVILGFVGVKMLVAHWWHIPIGISLGFILLTLAVTILASWKFPKK